ncbi:MAG: outer membrane protein assembly factor BamD [Holosporales bacterium]|jgi:outer membrane protein assembly factor BamD|nr:outer membrane protein assembly factor BamD [Holosporales bacterium]
MKRVILSTILLFLTGCSKDIDFKAMEQKSAEEIFEIGKKEMDAKHYSDAVKVFEELEKLHPYSKLVAEAQLNSGDCSYKAKKVDEATSAYEIFVKTHPLHQKAPYAIYMLGLINYEKMPLIERDQEVTITSLSYFQELCNRYPDSEYSKDAEKKAEELRQQIAGKEVYVARYYQEHRNYAAAIGRLNIIEDLYADTIHGPESLHRLVECYIAMGFLDEAKRTNEMLQLRHPNSNWAKYAKTLLENRQKTTP